MDKHEIKKTLLTVTFNKIKDLILSNKITEAQTAVELLDTQLKEIDNLQSDMSFTIGEFVTLDDPEAREIIDIYSYRDICYLNNVYTITDVDDHYIYLKSIKNRDEAVGNKVSIKWHIQSEFKRMTKLNIKSQAVSMNLGNW